jgi:biopolymer transport protein ExbB/biopolymer transport protein TolQ
MLVSKLLAVAQVGGSAVLYILLLLSVISIGVIIERWWWFRKRRVDPRALSQDVFKKLAANDRSGLDKVLAQSESMEAEILRDALGWYEKGPDSVKEILDKGIRDRRKEYEGGLVFLGTLGNNAPFIGLFGTVLGIVTAFKELGDTTAGSAGAGNMNNVMSGIAEALVATAIGILVAIPAVVAYNIFTKKAAEIEENVGALGNAMVAHMKGEGPDGPLEASHHEHAAKKKESARIPSAVLKPEAEA